MYSPLKDKDVHVRKNALMVLSHLILNDMIKVKGEICELAICLEDPEPRISDLTHIFFEELSRKGQNPIYNILPDIISRLSVASDRVSEELFQRITTFLLSFIDKVCWLSIVVSPSCSFTDCSIYRNGKLKVSSKSCAIVSRPQMVCG